MLSYLLSYLVMKMTISVSMETEDVERLKAFAAKSGRSVSEVVRGWMEVALFAAEVEGNEPMTKELVDTGHGLYPTGTDHVSRPLRKAPPEQRPRRQRQQTTVEEADVQSALAAEPTVEDVLATMAPVAASAPEPQYEYGWAKREMGLP